MTDRGGVVSSARLEAFSDGVLAIAITLLVLDLVVPEHRPGGLLRSLGEIWPSYLAYIAAFFSIGVIWLNHHAAFARVRFVDRGVLSINLLLLLFASVLPFPTAVLADAFRVGDLADQRVAIVLYGLVSTLTGAVWLLLYQYLLSADRLTHDDVAPDYFGLQRRRALAGIIGSLLAAVVGAVLSPPVGLALYVAIPLFYALTSEGVRPAPRRPSADRPPRP